MSLRQQRSITLKHPAERHRNGEIPKPAWNPKQIKLIQDLDLLPISTLTKDGAFRDSHILYHRSDDFVIGQLKARLDKKHHPHKVFEENKTQPLIPFEEITWASKKLKNEIRFKNSFAPENHGAPCCDCDDECEEICVCYDSVREW